MAIDPARASGPVSADLFGSIAINTDSFAKHVTDARALSLGYLRFPGGTLAETGVVDAKGDLVLGPGPIPRSALLGDRGGLAYDLSFPELVNPTALAADAADGGANRIGSLSDVFSEAVRTGSDVGIILPVTRYYGGVNLLDAKAKSDALALMARDVAAFCDRLESGAFNGGRYPETIILEIGNEAYGSPIEYALFAKTMIQTIETRLGDSGLDIRIAPQMHQGSQPFTELFESGYFDQWFDGAGTPRLPELAGFRFDPDVMPGYAQKATLLDRMMTHIIGSDLRHVDALRQHYLAADVEAIEDADSLLNQRDDILKVWTEAAAKAGANPAAIEHYVSAWTSDALRGEDGAWHMSAATNTLALFAHMLKSGVDRAAAWGLIAGTKPGGAATPGTSISVETGTGFSPHGEVLGLMSRNLRGKALIEAGIDPSGAGSDGDRLYHYASETETVLYVSAGAVAGSSRTVTIDIRDIGRFSQVSLSLVGTAGGGDTGAGQVVQSVIDASRGTITLTFAQDFQVAQIVLKDVHALGRERWGTGGADQLTGTLRDDTLWGGDGDDRLTGGAEEDRLLGGNGRDILFGGSNADRLDGGSGHDSLDGGPGDDHLTGGGQDDRLAGGPGQDRLESGGGNDVLLGGDGNDTLAGGSGRDTLTGGAGRDTFVFDAQAGPDRITDFRADQDRLDLRETEWIHSRADLSARARVVGADLVLAVGDGDTITLSGCGGLPLSSLSILV